MLQILQKMLENIKKMSENGGSATSPDDVPCGEQEVEMHPI